jgi:hypothetical protein
VELFRLPGMASLIDVLAVFERFMNGLGMKDPVRVSLGSYLLNRFSPPLDELVFDLEQHTNVLRFKDHPTASSIRLRACVKHLLSNPIPAFIVVCNGLGKELFRVEGRGKDDLYENLCRMCHSMIVSQPESESLHPSWLGLLGKVTREVRVFRIDSADARAKMSQDLLLGVLDEIVRLLVPGGN